MKNWEFLKLFIFIGLTTICAILFSSKLGDIPPLAKFLNPFTGFWQNATSERNQLEYHIFLQKTTMMYILLKGLLQQRIAYGKWISKVVMRRVGYLK